MSVASLVDSTSQAIQVAQRLVAMDRIVEARACAPSRGGVLINVCICQEVLQ